jgi:hypothetical protein
VEWQVVLLSQLPQGADRVHLRGSTYIHTFKNKGERKLIEQGIHTWNASEQWIEKRLSLLDELGLHNTQEANKHGRRVTAEYYTNHHKHNHNIRKRGLTTPCGCCGAEATMRMVC